MADIEYPNLIEGNAAHETGVRTYPDLINGGVMQETQAAAAGSILLQVMQHGLYAGGAG